MKHRVYTRQEGKDRYWAVNVELGFEVKGTSKVAAMDGMVAALRWVAQHSEEQRIQSGLFFSPKKRDILWWYWQKFISSFLPAKTRGNCFVVVLEELEELGELKA